MDTHFHIIAVLKARLADPNDEAIKRANQQAHFARMLCYQVHVVDLLFLEKAWFTIVSCYLYGFCMFFIEVGLATFEDLKRSKIT